jgi:hypothetical protein
MDSAVALEELSTVSPATGQADGNGAPPDPTATLTEAGGLTDIGRYAARLAAFERTVLPMAGHRLGDGGLGRLTFRLAGLIDDVRDGTESRPAGSVINDDAAQALHELDADS